jgi:hypothetical protein
MLIIFLRSHLKPYSVPPSRYYITIQSNLSTIQECFVVSKQDFTTLRFNPPIIVTTDHTWIIKLQII